MITQMCTVQAQHENYCALRRIVFKYLYSTSIYRGRPSWYVTHSSSCVILLFAQIDHDRFRQTLQAGLQVLDMKRRCIRSLKMTETRNDQLVNKDLVITKGS